MQVFGADGIAYLIYSANRINTGPHGDPTELQKLGLWQCSCRYRGETKHGKRHLVFYVTINNVRRVESLHNEIVIYVNKTSSLILRESSSPRLSSQHFGILSTTLVPFLNSFSAAKIVVECLALHGRSSRPMVTTPFVTVTMCLDCSPRWLQPSPSIAQTTLTMCPAK